ncbi:MAG: hypothetical protein Q8O00_08645 [Holophaga sp.]|nr:hypothetical protein [Holophaga sp.]
MTKKINVPEGEAKARESARHRALKLGMAEYTLWHAQENGPPQGFASYPKDGHMEHVELKASAGRQHLSGLVWKATGEALSRQDLDGTLDGLEAAAIHDGPRLPVHVRVADLGNRIYLDLSDDAWRVVEVTAQGWRVMPGEQAPVRFRRPNGTQALPVPEQGGNLADLRRFIHSDDAGFVLASAWLLGTMTDRGAQPVLSIGGEHGSAKSTSTRVLQRMVDPRGGALRSAPKGDRDLAIAARNSWIASFDNLSRIPPDLADGLCRLSTGSAFSTRQLYTDGEESIFAARRPVILNSIVDVTNRPDLSDRTVSMQLLRIGEAQRIEEGAFWPAFEEARPRILGALLTALAGALARWDTTKPERMPRMSDFYRLILAAEPDMPWTPGEFEAAWKAMEESAVENVLQATPLSSVLMPILEARGKWKAPASELLRTLNSARPLGTEPDGWPQTPQGLVGALRRLSPTLEKVGWHVRLGVRDTTDAHGRLVLIVRSEAMAERAGILEHEAGMTLVQAEDLAALEAAS